MEKENKFHVDALEVTFTVSGEVKEKLRAIEKSALSGSIILRRCESHSYHQEFVIVWKGMYWGYLFFDSPNKFRNDVYIRVANEVLYNKLLFADRFAIAEALGLEFKRVSKLDVACDFNFNVQRLLMRAYKNEDYKLLINGMVEDGKTIPHIGGVAFNNPRQRPFQNHEVIADNEHKTLKMRCYNKGREIERSGKGYIIAANGFKGNCTYRIEMSCKNYKALCPTLKSLKLSDAELYKGLDDRNVLALVFRKLMDRVIRLQKGRKANNILSVALKGLEIRDLTA